MPHEVFSVEAPAHGLCVDVIYVPKSRYTGEYLLEFAHGSTDTVFSTTSVVRKEDVVGLEPFAARRKIERIAQEMEVNYMRLSHSQDLASRRAAYQSKNRRLGFS